MIHEAKSLDMIQNPEVKDLAHIGEPGNYKDYIYTENGEWEEMNIGLNMNQYDLYKTTVVQLPTLNMAQIEQAKGDIVRFREEHSNIYYMMLNRDINYYTLFVYDENNNIKEDKFENAVVDCIKAQGEIKAISYQEDNNAIEFWVKTSDDACSVGYLFGYDEGVVKYN